MYTWTGGVYPDRADGGNLDSGDIGGTGNSVLYDSSEEGTGCEEKGGYAGSEHGV